jgi:hypothetical protein
MTLALFALAVALVHALARLVASLDRALARDGLPFCRRCLRRRVEDWMTCNTLVGPRCDGGLWYLILRARYGKARYGKAREEDER